MTPEERREALAARRDRVKRHRKRVPRPRLPRGPESRYEAALVRLSRRMSALVDRTIQPYIAHARKAEAGEREDVQIDTALLGHDYGTLRIMIGRMVREAEISPIVDQWGREIRKWNGREMARLLLIDLSEESPELLATLANARATNVRLIQSIGDRLLGDVFETVTRSVMAGTRVEALASRIQERYSVSDSRARLIARDQTLKANADLTRVRHREAGVTSYVWSSSRDERVRDVHAELDGFEFRWDDPPITSLTGERNHPGEDYQCRCVAVPVLD